MPILILWWQIPSFLIISVMAPMDDKEEIACLWQKNKKQKKRRWGMKTMDSKKQLEYFWMDSSTLNEQVGHLAPFLHHLGR